MPVICVVVAGWSIARVEAAARSVLEAGAVPRVAVEDGRLWADGSGVRLDRAVSELRRILSGSDSERVRYGIAESPIAAYAAAVHAGEERNGCAIVPAGTDSEFLAPLPVSVLEPEERLLGLLEGVGIGTCGEFAALPREAVEVRFGGEAVASWRLAGAEDGRRLFRPIPSERPAASIDFVEYVVTSPEQLLFTTNALLGNLCAALVERGEHARAMRFDLPLANGTRWSRLLRPARPTASRTIWLRLARSMLERLTVPDAVSGVELRVEATETAAAVQGDLFDSGFATCGAVEAAVERLLETQGPVLVRPDVGEHPLPERRTAFEPVEIESLLRTEVSRTGEKIDWPAGEGCPAGLTIQLLPTPRPVLVESVQRRDHIVPIRYRDGRWKQFTTVAGPDRISGGQWEDAYAREYFRGVTGEGTLVLLFYDARADAWFLHGWWD
ncbi:MAG: hypothetical protein ACREMQ_21930 [Longimicrobiales bacterium]